MISYLIDLTYLLRNWSSIQNDPSDDETSSMRQSIERLQEMRILLDRIRPFEKKMRYQIDKILALSTSSFAVVSELNTNRNHAYIPETDPLSYKPNPENMIFDDDNSDEDNDEFEFAKEPKKSVAVAKPMENQGERAMIYKPPRLSAAPFHEKEKSEAKVARMKKSDMEKMKKSELMQTIKAQFSDKPEEDDLRGGANVGKQREAARRYAERVAEKDRYE